MNKISLPHEKFMQINKKLLKKYNAIRKSLLVVNYQI